MEEVVMLLVSLLSYRLLHELQQRQRQTALNMSICDIVLKYVSDLHRLVPWSHGTSLSPSAPSLLPPGRG